MAFDKLRPSRACRGMGAERWLGPGLSCPSRYFAGAAWNFAVQDALQNRYSVASCVRRGGVSAPTVIPHTGSIDGAGTPACDGV